MKTTGMKLFAVKTAPPPAAEVKRGQETPDPPHVCLEKHAPIGVLPNITVRVLFEGRRVPPVSFYSAKATGNKSAFISRFSPTQTPNQCGNMRRPPSSRRGEALSEREATGCSGSLGAASSESTAGSVRLRGCGC